MKRIMGLDVGSKTLGIAMSDLLGMTAQGIETVAINESEGYYGLDRLEEIIQAYDVKEIVVGLPKNMDGTEGERAEKSRAYAQRLERQFDLPIHLVDERLTTQQAERMLVEEGDVSRKKRQEIIDKLAAVLILQGYLDSIY